MSATLAEGSVFARRYRVVRLIAAGAMGAVHEVVDLETERHRALKVMHAHLFQSQEMRERFQREARITGKVVSDHIVDVFDTGVDEPTGMPFLVMELLRGEELGERIKRLGRLPPVEVITYLHQAALALDRTHAASIVHRDLKPANLFLAQRDDGSVHVKILDFGVAKLIAEGATAAGATSSLGTPLYMPPEQLQGGSRLTPAADIFALGMMAYTMLVGVPYWSPEASRADGVIAFAMMAVRGPQEPPVQRALAYGVVLPPGFDAWFARATAVDPAARFRRATEAVHALGEVLGVPVGGLRASFTSAPSWPGVAPAAAPVAPAFAPTEPAPARSSGPELDARAHGLALAGTSTGAAVSGLPSKPPRSSRAPLVAGLAVLGLGVALGGGWLALRAAGGGEPTVAASDALSGSASAPGPSVTPEPTAAAPEPTAAAPEPTAAAPEPTAAAPESTTMAPTAPAPVAASAGPGGASVEPSAASTGRISPDGPAGAPSVVPTSEAFPTASLRPSASPTPTTKPVPPTAASPSARPASSASETPRPPRPVPSSLFGRR